MRPVRPLGLERQLSIGIVLLLVPALVGLWTGNLTVATVCLGAWLVAAFGLSRRLAHSIGHLERAAHRIASGDFSPLERQPMATREFAQLQDTFDLMLQQFNRTRAALDRQMADERRVREELQSLQHQVIQQERLAAVGQLVSGVAHEINNPLQAIMGFAELMQMEPDVPDAMRDDLRLIQKESTRACNIMKNLARFARQQPMVAAPLRMSEVVMSVVELRQRRLATQGIELEVAELQQVLLNFVVNAEQALLQSGRVPGRITIRTADRGDRVVVEVEDTGPGVPDADAARLFQPFFTTKPVGHGTGLGLSVSYGIIDSFGGRIGYRAGSDGGALFFFDLPAAKAEAA
jgi:C4-dicarboxylate-specific signal transduction histidine kinase